MQEKIENGIFLVDLLQLAVLAGLDRPAARVYIIAEKAVRMESLRLHNSSGPYFHSFELPGSRVLSLLTNSWIIEQHRESRNALLRAQRFVVLAVDLGNGHRMLHILRQRLPQRCQLLAMPTPTSQ